MKKTGLFKIIMFMLIGITVASWIFSAGYFNEGSVVAVDMYNIGFFDFFALLFGAFKFEYFVQIFILLLSIGALYGVLGKTGKYRAWIEKIVNKLKGQELIFLIVISFVLAALTAMFDYELIILIFIPFIISIILSMGYDKYTALIATIGSILVGTIGNLRGNNVSIIISDLLSTDVKTGFYYKLALAFLSLIVLVIYLSKAKRVRKTSETLENEDRFIGEKISNKYSTVPLIVIMSLLLVLMIVACTHWTDAFGITFFDDLHSKITGLSIKLPYFHVEPSKIDAGTHDVEIFARLLGTSSAFGKWSYAEMSVICIMASIIIGLFYRIKGIFATMLNGAKKMFMPALMVLLAYVVLFYSGSQMFYPTMAAIILSISSKFSIILSTIVLIFGSTLFVDTLYVANYLVPQLAAVEGASNIVITLLTQGIYGVVMFIAPTSALLVFGLTYLEIPYKSWIKKIWKLALALFVVVMVISLLARYL